MHVLIVLVTLKATEAGEVGEDSTTKRDQAMLNKSALLAGHA
jgi:hypothetical protein